MQFRHFVFFYLNWIIVVCIDINLKLLNNKALFNEKIVMLVFFERIVMLVKRCIDL
jgi:hypothetical protein